jgi:wyosine [tRNA(Phe)-imidazoG37] synthetase (radical SAM superfamily)
MGERFVYGPVPSRRLGLSLGVDLIPHKVCCYDCSYCQVGPTTELTLLRRPFVDPDEVVREVERALRERRAAELVTLSGSGEPTLYGPLRELVAGLRRVTALPLALLTNGALLWDDEVVQAALGFDVVAPSLDAADEETFARINRPAAGLTFARMVDGLRGFCRRFTGTCRLEVMLVQGENDSLSSLSALARLARALQPTTVDLNTVVRPPAHGARPLPAAELTSALLSFAACREPNIIASYRGSRQVVAPPVDLDLDTPRRRILELVSRRPCTVADLGASLGLGVEDVQRHCSAAVAADELEERAVGSAIYYATVEQRS